METKSLLFGLIGFFLGGLLVSVAATTLNKPVGYVSDMPMAQMADTLKDRQGDEYDKAFVAAMIEHHRGAIEMAKLSARNAKHDQIKVLSRDIIAAQETEIKNMKRWQVEWGYGIDDMNPSEHNESMRR